MGLGAILVDEVILFFALILGFERKFKGSF